MKLKVRPSTVFERRLIANEDRMRAKTDGIDRLFFLSAGGLALFLLLFLGIHCMVKVADFSSDPYGARALLRRGLVGCLLASLICFCAVLWRLPRLGINNEFSE